MSERNHDRGPRWQELMRIGGLDGNDRARLWDAMRASQGVIRRRMGRPHGAPIRYEQREQLVATTMDCDSAALDVNELPYTHFGGLFIGSFACGYANVGDPHVPTLLLSYRQLMAAPSQLPPGADPTEAPWAFREGCWYVCGWADVLEAAEFTARYEEHESHGYVSCICCGYDMACRGVLDGPHPHFCTECQKAGCEHEGAEERGTSECLWLEREDEDHDIEPDE